MSEIRIPDYVNIVYSDITHSNMIDRRDCYLFNPPVRFKRVLLGYYRNRVFFQTIVLKQAHIFEADTE
jgi:hypothetical protein